MNIEPIIHFVFIAAACFLGCLLGDISLRWWRSRKNSVVISRMIDNAINLPGFTDTQIVSAEITFKIMRKGDPSSTEASTDGIQNSPPQ